jgi:hypothetical protein
MNYTEYAKSLNANVEVLSWIEHTLANYLKKNEENQGEIEHIIDYLISPEAPQKNLTAMSYNDAKKNTERWVTLMNKRATHIKETAEDTKVVLDFKNGFKIVRLVGKNAYQREGLLMGHCVGSYFGNKKEIYSLRDKNNMPHCTMEKDQQIKGKGNGDIHPKYIDYVVRFLEHVGMKVRDSEMKHLGYEVEAFPEYCKNKLYRDRYIRSGEKVKYSDKVVVYTDFFTARTYKGSKICLYKGDLKITEKNVSLGKIQAVGGYLYINSNAELPNLKSVGGDLYINSNAELKAENLKSVGGDLYINSNAELPNLKSVGGDLYIYSNAELPNLKSVGGDLYINSNAELKAENLKSVGGDLSIYSNAELKAENLKSVGGYLYINSNAG